MGSKGFIALCLERQVPPEAIDDFVEQWHKGDSVESLSEFLGMSLEEYALWVERPESLTFILAAHDRGVPLQELLLQAQDVPDWAAEATKLTEWLKRKAEVQAKRIAG